MESGVYQIFCETNKKSYIGSSKNIKRRWETHQTALKNKRHVNSHLQSAWEKYTSCAFKFNTLELCKEELLLEREQYWLEHFNSSDREFGFNQSAIASNFAPCKRYIITSPSGEVFDITNLERFCKQNDLGPTGLHKVASGEANQYKGWLCRHFEDSTETWENKRRRGKKSGPGHKGSWLIEFEDGHTNIVNSLLKYCKENNYSHGGIYELMRGKRSKVRDIVKITKIN